VGVHDAADVRTVPVHVGVRGGVAGRRQFTIDNLAVQVADDHRISGQVVVGHSGRLDHDDLAAGGIGRPGRDVAGRPDDQAVPDELGTPRH
jgi:hypothetical protein